MVNAQHAGFRGHEFNPILEQVFFFILLLIYLFLTLLKIIRKVK